MAESRELDEDHCAELLRSGVIGRAALTTPSGPHIVPVNYSVVDDQIVIRTAPHSMLGTYGPGSLVAFEVDRIDYERHLGWSVLARGRAHAVTDQAVIKRIYGTWPPRPWADGPRSLFLGLPWDELTGVRLGRGWTDRNESPVRRRV
jgi:hypothetical protein